MPGTHFPVKIAVCDDEQSARRILMDAISKYLDRHDLMVEITEFASGEEFLASDTDSFHLVFFDIFMGGINGMDTARKLFSGNTRTKIVFCSASEVYGVQSYDVRAMRYLVKPVEEKRLFDVLDDFFHIYTTLKTITVRADRVEESIYVNDIIWLESEDHNCIIHTVERDYVTRSTFAQLAEKLPAADFFRPVRYAMVAFRAVKGIPSDKLLLSDGTVIPIPKDSRASVKRAYMDYQWKVLSDK
ncbi:MAG: response regulator transcription factor [Lachnospiraceae bacterium]|nr:response regulator transcription factor [Lachnospiraceae bacterium]